MFSRQRALSITFMLTAVALLTLLGLILTSPVVARPLAGHTWTVGGVCGSTIQACIDYAASGDTVLVPAGTYHERLFLNKGVSLLGHGAETTIVRSPEARRETLKIYGSSAPPSPIDRSTVISGLTFTGGDGWVSGGGISMQMLLTVTVQNVRVTGNRARSAGGGIVVLSGASTILSNVVITGNTARGEFGYGGGGLHVGGGTVWLNNVLVADNQDGAGRGQIEVSSGSLYLQHGTITGSSRNPAAGLVTRGGMAVVNNTIVTNQTVGLSAEAGSLNGDYNLFHNNLTNTLYISSGLHDVFGDPAFVDPAHGNYRLLDRSAAIDRGTNAGVTFDFDGDARPDGTGWDIGFDEHRRSAITLTTPSAHQVISSATTSLAGLTLPIDQISQVDVSTNNGETWAAAIGTSAFAYTWTVLPEDGVPHVLLARGTDRTHNLGWSDPVTITVDRIPPQSAISAPVLGQVLRGHEYTVTGTTSDGGGVSQLEISVDNGATYSPVVPQHNWTWPWSIPAEDGVSHLLRVRATDLAGNVRADPATVAVFVDNVPPVIRFNNILTNGVTTVLSDTFTVIGSSNGALSTTLTLNGGEEIPVDVVDHTFTQTLSSLITGTYTLRGVATDVAGNIAEVTATLVVTPYIPIPRFIFLPLVFRNFDPLRDRYEEDTPYSAAPTILTDGSIQHRNFYPANDVDWARWEATPGTYLINATGLALDTDTVLRLYAANGATQLIQNDDCTPYTRSSCLTWTVATSSTLYLRITPYDANSIGSERWYDLTVVKQ